jgi:hypothetical protein
VDCSLLCVALLCFSCFSCFRFSLVLLQIVVQGSGNGQHLVDGLVENAVGCNWFVLYSLTEALNQGS